MFWKLLKPGGGGEPTGAIASAIDSELGGYAAFKEAFTKAATTRFGSGWAWLVVGKDGKLSITSYPNQDSPYAEGQTPSSGSTSGSMPTTSSTRIVAPNTSRRSGT